VKFVEEKSVGGCPLPTDAFIEYEPLAIEKFGTVKVRVAVPLVLDVALFKFSITVLPDIQAKFTCVPAG